MNNKNFKKMFLIMVLLVLGLSFTACKKEDKIDEPNYTVEDLNTQYTDNLKLTTSYEDMQFLSKGIEKVTLLQAVDGDTARFENSNGNTLKIRFLGINTPESTGQIAPWGKKASTFTKNKLQNAVEIVIEGENVGSPAELDTTGSRYLAYVWYRPSAGQDLRLLNLEIVEQCFSYFTGDSTSSKYGETLREAFLKSYQTKLRVFGEQDPDFSYSTEIRDISIAELRNNYSSYSTGSRLKMKVRVVRLVGNSLYVEDLEETENEDTNTSSKAAIFLYHSFVSGLGKYKPGHVISFECQASDDEVYGAQLVNPRNLHVIETGSEYTITQIDDTVTSLKDYEGFVVKVNEVTVNRLSNESETDAFTIYCTMKNGSELMIRIDADVSPKIAYTSPKVGSKYDVIGGVSKYINVYDGNKVYYQIKLGNITSETMGDFKLSANQN